jgi:hypothetical protein
MPAAETARLISSLEMQDKGFTRTADKAQRSLTGLEKSNNRIAASNARTGRSFAAMGTGIGKAQGGLGNFIKTGAGLLGLTLGIAGVTRALTGTIDAAAEFGANVTKVQRVTGLSAATASAMVDTLDKWGVAGDRIIPMLGRMEKNVGALAGSHKKAAEFQKKFGINLLDSNGKIADANTLLLRSADYWNSNASATDKAVVMSKLWGKAWQDLIPILSKGSGFIKAQEKDAIHLTSTQLRNIQKFRDAQREFADITGDVAVKIGAELMPAITEVIKPLGAWLDTHSDDIAKFFKDGTKFAQEMGAAVQNYVVPALGTIGKAWNAIPSELRQLIIGGIVANKVLKMTIGFDPLNIVRKGFTDVFKSVLGIKAGVVNVQGAIVNGGAGGVGDVLAKGGKMAAVVAALEALGTGALVVGGAAVAGVIATAVATAVGKALMGESNFQQAITPGTPSYNRIANARNPYAHMAGGPSDQLSPREIRAIAEAVNTKASTLGNLAPVDRRGYTGFEGRGPGYRPADAIKATSEGFAKQLAAIRQLHEDFAKQYSLLKSSRDPAVIAAAATATTAKITQGVGSVKTTKDVIATLKAQLAVTKDPALRKVLTEALRKVERKLPGREWIDAQKTSAKTIAKSNESVATKVKELKGIQQSLLSHGDTAAANIVGALLNGVVPAINSISIPAPIYPGLPTILPERNKRPTKDSTAPATGANKPIGIEKNRPGQQFVVTATHRDNVRSSQHKTRYSPDRQG